jgi:hypothetical protein
MVRDHRRPGGTLVALEAGESVARSRGGHELKNQNIVRPAAIVIVGPVVGIGPPRVAGAS